MFLNSMLPKRNEGITEMICFALFFWESTTFKARSSFSPSASYNSMEITVGAPVSRMNVYGRPSIVT